MLKFRMEPSPAFSRIRTEETSTFVPVASEPYFSMAAATILSRRETRKNRPAAAMRARIPSAVRTLPVVFIAVFSPCGNVPSPRRLVSFLGVSHASRKPRKPDSPVLFHG